LILSLIYLFIKEIKKNAGKKKIILEYEEEKEDLRETDAL